MSATNQVSYTTRPSANSDGDYEYAVSFDFLRDTDLAVYVNDALVSPTVMNDAGDSIVLTAAQNAAADDTVDIVRNTDASEPYVTFFDSAGWTAEDLNGAVLQALYTAQDANLRLDNLDGGGSPTTVPTATAADRFLVSKVDGGGFSWTIQTVAQVQSTLGITTPVTVPSPTSGSYILFTDDSTNTYELRTLSQALSAIWTAALAEESTYPGIALRPIQSSQGNQFVITASDASHVGYADAAYCRNLMGIGSAGLLSAGTSVGNLVQLVSHASGAALPAVRGDNLLGVTKSIDYIKYKRFQRNRTRDVASASYWNPMSETPTLIQDSTTAGWHSSTTYGVTLTAGTYIIRAEAGLDTGNTGTVNGMRLTGSGSISPSAIYDIGAPSTNPDTTAGNLNASAVGSHFSVEGTVTISTGSSEIAVGCQLSATTKFSGVILHIWKIA